MMTVVNIHQFQNFPLLVAPSGSYACFPMQIYPYFRILVVTSHNQSILQKPHLIVEDRCDQPGVYCAKG